MSGYEQSLLNLKRYKYDIYKCGTPIALLIIENIFINVQPFYFQVRLIDTKQFNSLKI